MIVTHILHPLIPAPLKQNICGEGAPLRERFPLEIPDSIFRFVNPLNRLRFSKSGVWSVIRTVAMFLHASERLGKFTDGFRKLPEVLFIPASRFSGTVIQRPISQCPGICSATCMKTAYERIRAGTCKAVEHGVIRRTDGASEIGASRLPLPRRDQFPRRLNEIFRIHKPNIFSRIELSIIIYNIFAHSTIKQGRDRHTRLLTPLLPNRECRTPDPPTRIFR